MIRLFTSGTHKGLTFSNEDIEKIQTTTQNQPDDNLPIVLGHPKNDLPIIGYLPRQAISIYDEGDKKSIGFDRAKAILSDESMDVLRKAGNNKISVRLQDGQITHIGLVKNAAVDENNNQDFATDTTIYHTSSDFEQTKPNIIKTIKNVFNMNKEPEQITSDFSALEAKINTLTNGIDRLVEAFAAEKKQSKEQIVKADFSSAEFTQLTDSERQTASDFAAGISNPDQYAQFIAILKASNKKPLITQGSVTTEFSSPQVKTTEDIISQQIKQLN
ncbi:MAG: hypothetical protein RR277_00395 [Rikenellaceae bacterium]